MTKIYRLPKVPQPSAVDLEREKKRIEELREQVEAALRRKPALTSKAAKILAEWMRKPTSKKRSA